MSTAETSLSVLKQLATTLNSEGSEHNSSASSEESAEPQVSSTTEKTSPPRGAFVPYSSPERILLQPAAIYSSTPVQSHFDPFLYQQHPSTSPIYSGQVTTRASPPATEDNTASTTRRTKRPNISYTALIAMAILNSREKKLQLHQIYDFILFKFPYYQTTTSKWKNCVRHNLSLSDRFVKLGRKDTRGNFWSINEKYYEELVRNISQNTDIAHTNYPALATAMGYQAMSYPGVSLPGSYLHTPLTLSLPSPSAFAGPLSTTPTNPFAVTNTTYQPNGQIITQQPFPTLEQYSGFQNYSYAHSSSLQGLSHSQGLHRYNNAHANRFRPY